MSAHLERLVCYSDSDSDDDGSPVNEAEPSLGRSSSGNQTEAAKGPPRGATAVPSKRKLPPLDYDSLEQQDHAARGSREQDSSKPPYARGEWLCYCFLQVPMTPALRTLVHASHDFIAKELDPGRMMAEKDGSPSTINGEALLGLNLSVAEHLHVSLTRPFTVRSHERDEFVKTAEAYIRRLPSEMTSFSFSFSRIACLANDDASRYFAVLEIGPGREQLRNLSTALSTELHLAFRAKTYYEEARFHASTTCLRVSTSAEDSADTLAPRFRALVERVESEWGSTLRRSTPLWTSRIGIQVANRIIYVDL